MDKSLEELYRIVENFVDNFKVHTHDGVNSQRIIQIMFATSSLPGSQAATAGNYGVFFVATRQCYVQAISEAHTTAGSDAGDVTLQVERLTGTEALDSGDELLETAFNLKATANTVQTGELKAGSKTLFFLNIGDRLAFKDAGTLTAVAGVCVTVQIQLL